MVPPFVFFLALAFSLSKTQKRADHLQSARRDRKDILHFHVITDRISAQTEGEHLNRGTIGGRFIGKTPPRNHSQDAG